jgi:hypothetical protein
MHAPPVANPIHPHSVSVYVPGNIDASDDTQQLKQPLIRPQATPSKMREGYSNTFTMALQVVGLGSGGDEEDCKVDENDEG